MCRRVPGHRTLQVRLDVDVALLYEAKSLCQMQAGSIGFTARGGMQTHFSTCVHWCLMCQHLLHSSRQSVAGRQRLAAVLTQGRAHNMPECRGLCGAHRFQPDSQLCIVHRSLPSSAGRSSGSATSGEHGRERFLLTVTWAHPIWQCRSLFGHMLLM